MGIKRQSPGKWQVFSETGVGALYNLYTYIPGTTDDKVTHTNKDGSADNTNPVVFDARGEADIWFNGTYDLKLTDENDVLIWTISDFGAGEDTVNYGNYNKVADGGFEDDTNGDNLPDQWATTAYPTAGSGAGVVVIDTGDQIEGANSLKFTSVGDGGGYAESAFFEVTEASILYLAWRMKSSAADVRNLVEVIWYTNAQVSISTSSIYDDSATNPTSWTKKTGNVTVVSAARYAKIRVTGCHSSDATTGSTWFDDVAIVDLIQTVDQLLGYTPADIAGDEFTGNVGIGVALETWLSSLTALQIAGLGSIYGSTSQAAGSDIEFSCNVYRNAAGVRSYIVADEASQIVFANGVITIRNAVSGAADSAISWNPPTVFNVTGNTSFGASISSIPPITAGSATVYTATLGISAYDTSRVYEVQVDEVNTGSFTMNFDTVGAKDVKLLDGTDPVAGQFAAGMIAKLLYDGTNLVLLNPALLQVADIVDAGALASLDTVDTAQIDAAAVTEAELAADVGAWIEVGSVTASNSTVSFTGIDNTYDIYKLVFWDVNDSGTGIFQCRFGNSSYQTSGYQQVDLDGATAGTGFGELSGTITAAGNYYSGEIIFYSPASAIGPSIEYRTICVGSNQDINHGVISNSNVTTINQVTFYEGSTNSLDSGEFRLYGLNT